jgi:heme exporter protein C
MEIIMKKRRWDILWKSAGILLVIYALVAGILVPLKPGIYKFSPSLVTSNSSLSMDILTYNTHLNQSNSNNVWLALPNDSLLKAKHTEVLTDNRIKALFDIPTNLPFDNGKTILATLIVDNEIDGYALYPDGVRIRYADNVMQSHSRFYSYDAVRKVDRFAFPFRNILYETIRNTFFHVAIWFAMFLLLIVSCYHSICYLRNKSIRHDFKSAALTTVALWFGIAGILTGSMWAKFTWGTFWTTDIKLNMSAIAMLIYLAYWILRMSIKDIDARARIAAVYNLFAFVCLMILVMVVPRLTDSLHPGNGGNPALGGEDLDNTLRAVFYPVIVGYTIIGLWMAQLYYRYMCLEDKWVSKEF